MSTEDRKITAPQSSHGTPGAKEKRLLRIFLSSPGDVAEERALAEIARQHRPDLKILFVTGYAQHAKIKDQFLGKDMDMLVKPFALDTLGHKIREMLS